jgi:hypothetical protein
MILRKIVLGLLILVSANQFLFAQQNERYQYRLSHPIKFGNENISSSPKTFDAGQDTITVVAILVQFQEDNTGLTTGNGRFDLSNKYFSNTLQRDTVVDAPPYDSAYFADHLRFLQNYYEKSSKGQTLISPRLYGTVVTLPKKMEEYSPRDGENFSRLGELYKDAWGIADSFIDFSAFNPAKTAFVVFHAGTGRDVDLKSILGFDPTPFDIPSVYLGLRNLREFYGAGYNGVQTAEGFFIQNSLIIPSTELRELDLSTGSVLVELGMNGILTASFGSYLGLPDLFNTSNGKTAIGRFGLMDGQSIFSFNGIFPPEPSAWEKVYLGWVNPVVISTGDATYRVKTSSSGTFTDSTMYKVLISSKEYFLIENRNRDPENDGQTVFTRNRAFNDSNVYTSDQDGFQYFDISSVNGNVVNVQTLDWSLPGLIDASNFYKGGILIWHIDENVIDANISSNTINNNIDHKGVDLEEAKGAQLIGVTFSTPFGDVTGDGTPVDYWYRGNHEVPTNIYKNEFTPTSFPNSLSYSLANNNIFITNFDSINTIMSFRVRIGAEITPIANFPKFLGVDSSGNAQPIAFDLNGTGTDEIFANANNSTYGYNTDGSGYTNPTGLLTTSGKFIPAYSSANNTNNVVIGGMNTIEFVNQAGTVISQNPLPDTLSAPLSPFNSFTAAGLDNGVIVEYSGYSQVNSYQASNSSIMQFTRAFGIDSVYQFIAAPNKYIVTGNILSSGSRDSLTVTGANEIFVNGTKLPNNYSYGSIQHSPVLADLNRDGKQEIIIVAGNKIFAINGQGVILDNFPVDKNVTSGVSVADVNGDSIFDLLFVTSDGDLYAYGTNGSVVAGFPVKVGPRTLSTPALANLNDTLGIVVYSGDGYLYGFKTGIAYNSNNVLWKNYLKDRFLTNNNTLSFTNGPVYSGVLPEGKVYNWPNPVYENKTFIRYYLNGAASGVTIKITDLSGELVATLNGTAFANTDNEVAWDVSQVQSGIYYGIIEADSERRIIKIAVVK